MNPKPTALESGSRVSATAGAVGRLYPSLRTLGLVLFLVTLLRYRSNTHRPVLGIWSIPYLLVVLLAAVMATMTAVRSWLRYRQGAESTSVRLTDIAILLWGAAYFMNGLKDPNQTGRIAILNFFGSSTPLPSLLEWLTLVLLFVAGAIWILPRLKPSHAKVALALASILATLLLIEGALRVKVIVAPATQGFPSASSDAWNRRYVAKNPEGWRDVAHNLAVSADTRRLLVIGDSYAFGQGIRNPQNRLGEQLVQKLNVGKDHWELINASRPDTNTLDQIGFLPQMLAYHPNIILLIYVFNDIDYLFPITPRISSVAQYYPGWILYRNFYLVQEIYLRSRLVYYRFATQGADPYADTQLVSRHLQDVKRFVTIGQGAGAQVWVVPFDVDQAPQFRARYHRFIVEARQAGIPVCSLEHTFDGLSLPKLTVNALDGHPNETANRLAAEEVARCLQP